MPVLGGRSETSVIVNFACLGRCVRTGSDMTNKTNLSIIRARVAHVRSEHIWRRLDVSLVVNFCDYNALVKAILFCA